VGLSERLGTVLPPFQGWGDGFRLKPGVYTPGYERPPFQGWDHGFRLNPGVYTPGYERPPFQGWGPRFPAQCRGLHPGYQRPAFQGWGDGFRLIQGFTPLTTNDRPSRAKNRFGRYWG
jgi:hypothetical protein